MTWSRRHPDMSHLRVETKDLVPTVEEGSPNPGLLTPLSSAGDGRRSSIASMNWSFMSQASSSATHPSSVVSFQSPNEPSTPPCIGFPTEISFYGSNMSFDGTEANSMEDYILHTPPTFHGNCDPGSCGFQEAPDCGLLSAKAGHSELALPLSTYHGLLPAAADFATALEADLIPSLDDRVHPCSTQWGAQHMAFLYTGQPAIENAAFGSVGNSEQGWSHESSQPWLPSTLAVDTSTILPADAVIDDVDNPHDGSFQFPHTELSSPCSNRGLQQPFEFLDKATFAEADLTRMKIQSPVCPSSWDKKEAVSRSGAKGARKARKGVPRGRRKAKEEKGDHYIQFGLKVTRTKSNKYYCTHVFDNGEPCAKPFKKVEHLKRHLIAHTGEKPFKCIVCETTFGRQDNKRDHYKTHLKDAPAGRNIRIGFDAFCALVRERNEPEEAEKTLAMLRKWKKNEDLKNNGGQS